MPKNLDLTDENVIKTIVGELEKSEDRDRKKDSFRSWEVYSGNQKPYVEYELQRTRPKSWDSYTVSDVSISRMVVDKLAQSYKDQPLRDVEEGVKNDRLEDIYKEADAKRQLKYLDTVTNLHKYSLMWVNFNDAYQRYQFMTLQPHEFSIVRDKDTGDLIGVILNYGNRDIVAGSNSGDGMDDLIAESQSDSSAQSKVYAMWSMENQVVVKVEETFVQTERGEEIKKSITYVPIDDNPKMRNKLGIIPFVFISKELAIDYPTKSPLAYQSIIYNALQSELLTAANIQGTGVLAIKYPTSLEGKFKSLTTGLFTALKLPQSKNPEDKPTEASYINPGPDLAGQRETYLSFLKQVLSEHGITTSTGVSGGSEAFSSALERMIANADVQNVIENNQELYTQAEIDMFDIIKVWEIFLGKNTYGEDDELGIVFTKPKVLVSDSEKLANIRTMFEMGLIEEHEKLMIFDPNLSEDKAKEKLERINSTRAEKARTFLSGNPERDLEGSRPGLEQSSREQPFES